MVPMRSCHACKNELSLDNKIGRREECPFCRADLHCCFNCTFYDETASKQCREPVAELVKEKQKANYCAYFIFAASRSADQATYVERARKELEDLFKPK